MRRFASAVACIVVALALGGPVSSARKDPRASAPDSMAAQIEPLFAAAKYDSILSLIPGFIRSAEARHDSVQLGRAIAQRGRVNLMLGRRVLAEPDIDLGIRIAESVRDTVGLMPAVHFKGFVYSMQGNYDQALRWFERRLFLAQRVQSPVDEAFARSSIGYIMHLRSDYVRARAEYTRAIELFRASGFERLEISPLIGLGRVESAVGNESDAIRCYQRAWVVAREVGDRVNEMWATNNLGALEGTHGDLSRSAEYSQHAYDIAKAIDYPHGLVIPAMNLAIRDEELGDFEGAEAVLQETRELCHRRGAEEFFSMVDCHFGELRLAQGRDQSAALMFRRALAATGALDPQIRWRAVIGLAQAMAASDSVSEALQLMLDDFDNPRAVPYADLEPTGFVLMSFLYAELGDDENALRRVTRARESAEHKGQERNAVLALLRESVYLRDLGRNAEAARAMGTALDRHEAFRGGISTGEWREVFGQEVAGIALEAARVLLVYPDSLSRFERERAFFDTMQRCKTRTLLDRITEPRFGPEAITERWSRRPATMTDLQAVLRPGELLLDFYVGSRRSTLMAVTADSSRLVDLEGAGSALDERIRLYRSIISSSDATVRAEYSPERLLAMQRMVGSSVLGGVADLVAAANRVFVAPDGFFAAIPFGTLVLDASDEPLLVTKDVLQVPSASVLVLQRSVGREMCVNNPRVVAIRGSSRLRGARDEVDELVSRYGDVTSVVGAAGADALENATNQCDVLHIAAHALVVDRSPWDSGIRLADAESGERSEPSERSESTAVDGTRAEGILSVRDSLLVAQTFRSDPYVRAWQIARLVLPAKLAVLSACETAGGRTTNGEGTLGITAAFLSAGVPVVASSLWPIDDRATARIMRAFYHHLAEGNPVATALRLAQLEARRSEDLSHPFYWAGFTVVGDGTLVVALAERTPRRDALFLIALLVGFALVALAVARHRRTPARVG